MALYNSLDQQKAHAATLAAAGTKAVTVSLLGGDRITGTVTQDGTGTRIVDTTGVTWHVPLVNVVAVGVAA